MPKRGFELTVRMREDLMTAYRSVYASCHSQMEAWEKTRRQPAPRYYVSPKRAYLVLSGMVQGDFTKVDALPCLKRKMFYDLLADVNDLSQRKEFMGKSLWFLCQFVVTRPAPEFYISVEALKKAITCSKKYGKNYHHHQIFGKLADKASR